MTTDTLLNERLIQTKIKSLPIVNGYRRRKHHGEPILGLEARAIDPVAIAIRKSNNNEQQKVFAYSKVLNSMQLAKTAKIAFKPEPWLNCIAYKNLIIAYVWDTREVMVVEENATAVSILKKTDWKDCTYDVYNAFEDRPMLKNSRNLPGINDFMKIANTWVQPFIRIAHYQTRTMKDVFRHEEYEIVTYAPNQGEIYIGEVMIQEYRANQFRSAIYMDNLLSDVWPKISSSAKKFTKQKLSKLVTFSDVQYALLDALTA